MRAISNLSHASKKIGLTQLGKESSRQGYMTRGFGQGEIEMKKQNSYGLPIHSWNKDSMKMMVYDTLHVRYFRKEALHFSTNVVWGAPC